MSDSRARSILVFRVGLLGDTLVALPAIEAIRERFPDHALVLLTSRPADPGWVSTWDVLRDTGWFERVVFYEPQLTSVRNLRALARMTQQLRRARFEHVFTLAPLRHPWQTRRDAFFFRHVVGCDSCFGAPAAPRSYRAEALAGVPSVHEALRLLRLVRPHARASDIEAFRLAIPVRDTRAAASALARHGLTGSERLVAFAPGARIAAKRWPQARFLDAGAALLARHRDIRLVVVGGPDDRLLGDALCEAWGERSLNLAGSLSVYGSAAVLARSVAYVGNDSGPMHLAAMVGTPCVAIFGAREVHGRWDPAGERHVVLREHMPCAGCMLEECVERGLACLKAISVEAVVAAASRHLDAVPAVSARSVPPLRLVQ